MGREISSSITTLYKVFTILIFAVLISISLYRTLFAPDSLNIFLSSLAMSFGFFIGRWLLNWKMVELTDKGIYISSDYFFDDREIFVPFEQIDSVHQSFLTRGNPELVSIKFLEMTSFGKKIWFIPKTRYFPVLKHPVVEEINRLASQNKRFIS